MIQVNRGLFRHLSRADEELMELFTGQPRTLRLDASEEEYRMIERKMEGKAANYQAGTAGSGEEWKPDSLAGQILEQVYAQNPFRQFHPVHRPDTDPYELPMEYIEHAELNAGVVDRYSEARIVPEGASFEASNAVVKPHSAEDPVVFQHKKVALALEYTSEFEEDALPEMLSNLKRFLAGALARGEMRQIILSATSGLESADATAGDAANDPTINIKDAIKALGEPYQKNMKDLVLYLKPSAWNELKSDPALIGKNGQNTLETGQLQKIWGIPIALCEALTSPGILVYRNGLHLSQRRGITLRSLPVDVNQDGSSSTYTKEVTRIEATMRSAVEFPYGRVAAQYRYPAAPSTAAGTRSQNGPTIVKLTAI